MMARVFVIDASRVSPRRATHFLLLRQEKVSKEKASRIRRPFASLRACCATRNRRGAQKLAPCGRSNICAPLSAASCVAHLLITAGTSRAPALLQRPATQDGATLSRPRSVLQRRGSRTGGARSPAVEAGLSSAAAGGSGLALFEAIAEFSQTPPDASSARNRAAALTSARLLVFA